MENFTTRIGKVGSQRPTKSTSGRERSPFQAEVASLQNLVDRLRPEERAALLALELIDNSGEISPKDVKLEDLSSERLFGKEAYDRLFRRPQGPITEVGLRYAILWRPSTCFSS